MNRYSTCIPVLNEFCVHLVIFSTFFIQRYQQVKTMLYKTLQLLLYVVKQAPLITIHLSNYKSKHYLLYSYCGDFAGTVII